MRCLRPHVDARFKFMYMFSFSASRSAFLAAHAAFLRDIFAASGLDSTAARMPALAAFNAPLSANGSAAISNTFTPSVTSISMAVRNPVTPDGKCVSSCFVTPRNIWDNTVSVL